MSNIFKLFASEPLYEFWWSNDLTLIIWNGIDGSAQIFSKKNISKLTVPKPPVPWRGEAISMIANTPLKI